MPTFPQYQAFVTAVEHASLAKAARELNLSPSAISKQVASLEKDLGIALLERGNRTIQPTEAGRLFYSKCKSILSAIREAEEAVATAHEEIAGRIRITIGSSFARSYLPKIFAEFSHLHPDVKLDIDVNDDVQDLLAEQIDFAFRLGALPDNRLRAIPLIETRPIYCASPSYIEQHGLPERPAELSNHQVMLLSTLNLTSATKKMIGRKDVNLPDLKRYHFTNDVNMLHAMTTAGLCVGAFLDCSVADDIAAKKLVRLFPHKHFPGKRLSLVHAKQDPMPRRLTAFKDFVKQASRALAGHSSDELSGAKP